MSGRNLDHKHRKGRVNKGLTTGDSGLIRGTVRKREGIRRNPPAPKPLPDLTDRNLEVYACLTAEAQTGKVISVQCGLTPQQAAVALLTLQNHGLAERVLHEGWRKP